MFRDVYLFKYLYNLAIAINQECLTVGSHIFLSVHAFFYPDAVRLDDLFVGVGEQIKGELKFGDKFLMRFLVVN